MTTDTETKLWTKLVNNNTGQEVGWFPCGIPELDKTLGLDPSVITTVIATIEALDGQDTISFVDEAHGVTTLYSVNPPEDERVEVEG